MPTRKVSNGPAKNNATKAAAKAEKEALKAAKALAKEAKALAKDDAVIFKEIYTIIQKEKDAGYDKLVDLVNKTPLKVLQEREGEKSLLEKAIDIRSLKIVKLLIDKGVPLKTKSTTETYLSMAVDSGNLDILKLLHSTGSIDINDGRLYPLLKAVSKGDIKILNYLLDNGADMNISKEGSRGVFLTAVRSGDEKMVKVLLDRGIDKTVLDDEERNAWFHLTWFKKTTVKTAKLLLDSGLDINKVDKKGYNPIAYYLIASYGDPIHPDLLKFFIDNGANINIKIGEGNSILHLFTNNYVPNHFDIIKDNIKMLVKAGLNVNIRNGLGRSPLLQIVVDSYKRPPHRSIDPLSKISILESAGADLNSKGPGYKIEHRPISNALIECIRIGFYTSAKYLIDKGTDLNWRPLSEMPDLGRGALHMLAVNKASETVALIKYFLTKPGIDKDILSNEGVTPLCLAVFTNNLENVKALVEGGADVNKIFEAGNAGSNALYYAALYDLPILEYLTRLEQTDKEVRYNGSTLFNLAKTTTKFKPEIREFIIKHYEKKQIVKLWKGWSRANAAQFDGVFSADSKEAADVTCCPICLKTVVRTDGCVYIQGHDCSQLEGFYHTGLYEKYKNSEGRITWCTICGRIARGHRHYALGPAQAVEKPELLTPGDPFTTDCKKDSGGGGIEEKMARYRRMREYALELQGEIGKKTENEALEEMVEEMWNAPMFRTAALRKIMEKREWNIPAQMFPLPIDDPVEDKGGVDMTKLPNIEKPSGDKDLLPIIVKGLDQIMQDEGDVIQFNHRQKDGHVFNHEGNCISAESLEMFITGQNGKFKTDESFGLCWAYPGNCNGRLYPSDVKPYIDPAVYNEYKDKFNWKFRAKTRGGAWATRKLKRGLKSVFVPASNAQCYLPIRGKKKI